MDEKAEPFRSALDKAMQVYLKEHYPNGVVTVSVLTCTCTCTNKTPFKYIWLCVWYHIFVLCAFHLYVYRSTCIMGKHSLLGKHPCTKFQGVNVAEACGSNLCKLVSEEVRKSRNSISDYPFIIDKRSKLSSQPYLTYKRLSSVRRI